MMPDISTWPIDAIVRFAMTEYLKNVELCKTIEQLQTALIAQLTKVEDLK